MLHVYALGLPAYIATELLARSLIALRDPRTQLFTNTGQVVLRVVLLALLLGSFQATTIPFALAVSAALEAALLLVLVLRHLLRLTGTAVSA